MKIFLGLYALVLFSASGSAYAGFRTPGYPVLPLFFILAALYVVIGSIASNPVNAFRGVLLLALGVPVFLYYSRGGRAVGR